MDRWLRNKTIVQIVALCLGTLLWLIVHLEQQPSNPGNPNPVLDNQTMIYSDVQIEVVGLDQEQFHIRHIDPTYVRVTVSGSPSDLRNINAGALDQSIVLDLNGFQPGTHNKVPLESRGYPEDVEVTISPPSVSVSIESISHKEVPVEVIVQGEPKEGFRAGEAIVQPNRVNVAVPESQIDQIVKVLTVVDISNVTEAVVTEKKLVAINQAGEEVDVTISPSVAEISIPITSPFKTVPLQIKFNGEVPSGFAIADFYQSVDEVTIYGAETDIESYDFYSGISINISDLNRAQTFAYTYNIPLQQQLHQVLPDKVDVLLRVVASQTKTFEDFPITLIGQNEEVHTEVTLPETGKFDLVLEGAPELLENVKPENVQAMIDVSNLPPGEYTRAIQLILPRFIKYGGEPEALQANVVISNYEDEPDENDEDVDGEGTAEEDEPVQSEPIDETEEESTDQDEQSTNDGTPESDTEDPPLGGDSDNPTDSNEIDNGDDPIEE